MAQGYFIGGGSLSDTTDSSRFEPTPVELRIKDIFPYPALEEFRRHTLQVISQNVELRLQVRTMAITALSTDIRSIFTNLLGTSIALMTAVGYERNRLLDVDSNLRILKPSEDRALLELKSLKVPNAYIDLLKNRLNQSDYQQRVAAYCAVVLLAGLLLRNVS